MFKSLREVYDVSSASKILKLFLKSSNSNELKDFLNLGIDVVGVLEIKKKLEQKKRELDLQIELSKEMVADSEKCGKLEARLRTLVHDHDTEKGVHLKKIQELQKQICSQNERVEASLAKYKDLEKQLQASIKKQKTVNFEQNGQSIDIPIFVDLSQCIFILQHIYIYIDRKRSC